MKYEEEGKKTKNRILSEFISNKINQNLIDSRKFNILNI